MEIHWLPLKSAEQLDDLITRSFSIPCLIFKHSTRCGTSSLAKYRLEADWAFTEEDIEAYYLDILALRPLSNRVAEAFSVHHESPQMLLIYRGECVFDASHLDISVQELKEAMAQEIDH